MEHFCHEGYVVLRNFYNEAEVSALRRSTQEVLTRLGAARLADQTAVATWDIEQMVKEMQSAVSAGVMGMDKFSEEVGRGVDEIRQVGSQLANIIEQVQALTPRTPRLHPAPPRLRIWNLSLTRRVSPSWIPSRHVK